MPPLSYRLWLHIISSRKTIALKAHNISGEWQVELIHWEQMYKGIGGVEISDVWVDEAYKIPVKKYCSLLREN